MGKLPPPGLIPPPTTTRPTRRKTLAQGLPKVPAGAESEPEKTVNHKPHASRVLRSQKALEAKGTDLKAVGREDDDFEPSEVFGIAYRDESLPVIPPAPPPTGKPRSGVLELLDQAEDPGYFFHEQERDGAPDEEMSDLDLAVEEAIRLLFGVRGIHHIGPGEDAEGDPVVLISANYGFSNVSMERVPEEVLGFKTLLVLPYELLPLRRERP